MFDPSAAPLVSILQGVVLVMLLVITSWTDTRTAKIRNIHTFPSMLAGLLLGLAGGGVNGLLTSASGLVAGFLLMLPLFVLHIMKAGDAKLLMAIGAIAGPGIAVRALFASFVLFLPVALVILTVRGGWSNMGLAFTRIWRFLYTTLHPGRVTEPINLPEGIWTPFAMVLGVATLVVWQTSFLDFGLNLGR